MSDKLKRYFQFLLIVLAAGAIYPIMYLKTNYQETILEVFNITLPQLNTIYSFLGIVWVVGYLPSGLLSDRFSAKKLLSISLFGTAAGGLWFAQIPNYTNVVIIYCIWGVFSVFTFWSAHMKLVKLLASREEEGRFFGILDGGRGVVEAVLASIALLIFSNILGDSTNIADKRSAIVAIIYMYSFVLLAIGILITIFVKDDEKLIASGKAQVVKQDSFRFSDLGKVFKNKFTYLMGGIIFLSYAVTWTVYYFGGFLQTNIGVDPVTVATITVIVLWMRPVGGIGGGILADKFGRGAIVMSALLATATCLIIMAVLPANMGASLFYALVVAGGMFLYAIRGTYWSLIGDCKIDNAIIGTAIGFISLVGYLPDIILGPFNSMLFKVFGDNGGYNAYFIASAIFGIIGACLVAAFIKMTKKERV
ncbi:MFS transporter [Clostridium thermosuccinogenes]|uniref:MFS transporter n=1 Tax=Clostridium thermosuccinogenes TaxID=84032 RepID=A0A2K2F7G6_9CLOT|nr:MFS transporter [Pseudoclostridium thermosuccinogenes]AUS94978.1 MFS transporter [Pseudoclostridium thermosuccinogenes]PNT91349.1 MFS transporter [Pseudoclostridium thermosuccinogenes]PNT94710.1 MFS transporter [Pseudoclostridium thermosuccinogenes]PNT95248.1 MFS transporter [Pseudoclostridium thermosuccinogenes]